VQGRNAHAHEKTCSIAAPHGIPGPQHNHHLLAYGNPQGPVNWAVSRRDTNLISRRSSLRCPERPGARKPQTTIVLDMDSSVSERGSAYTAHFALHVLLLLFVFDQARPSRFPHGIVGRVRGWSFTSALHRNAVMTRSAHEWRIAPAPGILTGSALIDPTRDRQPVHRTIPGTDVRRHLARAVLRLFGPRTRHCVSGTSCSGSGELKCRKSAT
jgi:hypothetical protein